MTSIIRSALFLLLLLLCISCNRAWQIADQDTDFYRVDYRVYEPDAAVDSLIAPYKAQIDATMNEVIGRTAVDLTKKRPESTLGNWISDLLLLEAQEMVDFPLDFAFQNYGGIRIPSITTGDISRGKIFELMPFENEVVILTGKGEPMRMLFDKMAAKGGWPVSAGIQMTIQDTIAQNVMIHNEPFDMERSYSFVCADYIANGGDKCDFLLDLDRVDPKVLIRDVIIQHLQKLTAQGKEAHAEISNRVKIGKDE